MKTGRLLNSLLIASTVSMIIATPARSQSVQVTRVQLNPTENGIEVILETPAGEQLQVLPRNDGNTYIADIPNTQLRLQGSNTFRQDNPIEGITTVTVTNQAANNIRVTVTGSKVVPTVELFDSDKGLVFSFTPVGNNTRSEQQTETPNAVESGSQTQQETTRSGDETPLASEAVAPASETQPNETSANEDEPIEIVVTGDRETGYSVPNATSATRTDTPLRDIPQSIQVVPRQVLEEQQVTRIGEAARNVSGVTPKPGYAGATDNYTIRGFDASNNLRNGFRDDGFYSFTDPANIERVEVLKGPASVLYGQIEPGGVVNYITKQPLDEPYYAGEFTVGSYDFYRPSIDISGPLNSDETLLYRLNIAYENSGSFRDFVDKELFVIAPVLTYKINDATTLTLEYEYINLNQTFDRGLPPLRESFELPISRNVGEQRDSYDFTAHRFSSILQHHFDNNWQIRNAFSIQTTDALRSNVQPSPFQLENDDRTLRRQFTEYPSYTQVYSLQTDLIGNFNTGSVQHQLLLGFELTKLIDEYEGRRVAFPSIDIFNPVYGFPIPTSFDQGFGAKTTTNNVGIYLQDQVTLLANLKLLIGGRLDLSILISKTFQTFLTVVIQKHLILTMKPFHLVLDWFTNQ